MLKRKLFFQLLAIAILYGACSKPDDPMVSTGTSPGDTIAIVQDSLGAGWQRINIDTSRQFSDIFFVDNQVGFVCGQNYIGKSTDGGLTWNSLLPSTFSGQFFNVFFIDANNGWAFGDRSLHTTNGGSTWSPMAGSNLFFDGQFFNASNGFMTTSNGALYKTTDGGATAQPVAIPGAMRVLYFSDSTHGWLSASSVFKTNNGGATFQQLASVNPNEIYAAQFTDSLHGWIAGPVVYKTVDGGATFQKILGSNTGGDIHFFDNNNGYILCGTRIYSTSNGAQTLNLLSRFSSASPLYEIHFTDASHGWVVADGGYIYRYVKP